MKKILCILLATLLILGLCACGSDNKGNDVKPTETIDVQANKYQQALTLFNETEYYDAKKLFDELGNYKESAKYSQHSYHLSYIKSTYLFAIKDLKSRLKSPSSLVVNGIRADVSISKYNEKTIVITYYIDYTAENSFGGAVRDVFENIVTTNTISNAAEREAFIQGLKDCFLLYDDLIISFK